MLDRATRRLEAVPGRPPRVEAAIRRIIGESYLVLGQYTKAEQHLRRAIDLRRQAQGPDDPNAIGATGILAEVLVGLNRFDEAETLAASALKGFQRVLGADHPDTLRAEHNLASIRILRGQPNADLPNPGRLGDAARAAMGSGSRDELMALNTRAFILERLGKRDEAETALRRVVEGLRRLNGDDDTDTIGAEHNLAGVLFRAGKLRESERLYVRALEAARRVAGPTIPRRLRRRATWPRPNSASVDRRTRCSCCGEPRRR